MKKAIKNQMTIQSITTKIALVTISIISLSPAFLATEAQATMAEPYVVDQLKDARYRLLRREYQILRDQDDLKKQLDDLKRRNDGNILSGTINEVAKRLDRTYVDLRQTRTAIRDVESNLL